MYNKKQRRIGEMLVEKGLITVDHLKFALAEQQRTKEFLGTILLKHSIIKQEELLKALSEQFNMPYISLQQSYIRWSLVAQFGADLVIDHKCFPVSINDWSVTFAIVNPLDLWAMKKCEEEARGLKAKFVLVSEADMEEAIVRYKQQLRGNISKMF